MSIVQTEAAKNEREQFDEWWQSTGQTVGQLTAWQAWKARALIEYPDAFDCEECEGNGEVNPKNNGDPQDYVPCSVCKGDGVVEWP